MEVHGPEMEGFTVLNVAVAEPAFTDYSLEFKRNMADNSKKGDPEQPKKEHVAEVNTATAEVTEKAQRPQQGPARSLLRSAS